MLRGIIPIAIDFNPRKNNRETLNFELSMKRSRVMARKALGVINPCEH
jgi:hypothetical protein